MEASYKEDDDSIILETDHIEVNANLPKNSGNASDCTNHSVDDWILEGEAGSIPPHRYRTRRASLSDDNDNDNQPEPMIPFRRRMPREINDTNRLGDVFIEGFIPEPNQTINRTQSRSSSPTLLDDLMVQLENPSNWLQIYGHWIILFVLILGGAVAVILVLILSPSIVTSSPTLNSTYFPTSLPTFAPTSSKFVQIKAIVEDATGVSIDIKILPSPQLQAIRWLSNDDDFNIYENSHATLLQRYALATFYFSTGGEEIWGIDRCNFLLTGKHICDWNGFSQYFSEYYETTNELLASCGVLCDISRSHAIGLFIEPDTLNGTLPEEIGLLSTLESIDIRSNDGLTGSLPRSIGKLKQLDFLSICETQLGGELPLSSQSLSELRILVLTENKFNGSLSFILDTFHNLQHIFLVFNEFTGTIPTSFGSLTKLESISLRHNFLTGKLALLDAYPMPRLDLFDFGNNLLEGTLPNAILPFSTLSDLYIQDNLLTGTISSNFVSLSNLRILSLGVNDLIGSIPPSFGSWSSIERLSLGLNNINGTIPSTLGNLLNLRKLILHNNWLSGTVPSELGQAIRLEELSLGGNVLTGEIPESLGFLTQLRSLSLRSMRIKGTVPTSFSNLQSLRVLYLFFTDLTGNLTFMSHLGPFSLAIADCRGDNPEIYCKFCTHCCADDEACFVRGTDTIFDL